MGLPGGNMKNSLIAGLIVLCLDLTAASVVRADVNPIEQRLVASLTAQGYAIVEEGYTWLGRLRIVADNGVLRREIVINPGTGEVLRDYAEAIQVAGDQGSARTAASHSGQGSGGTALAVGTIGAASAVVGTGTIDGSAGTSPLPVQTPPALVLDPALPN